MNLRTRYALNGAIIFYLGVIYFSGMPATNILNSRLKEKASAVAFALGIWPSWSMFAPNPIKFDSKTFIKLTYKSGETVEHDVEKELTGPMAIFRKARWMKYAQDNIRNPSQRALLAPVMAHFTKKFERPNDPITLVQVKRKWLEVAPFTESGVASIDSTPRRERHETLMIKKWERK